MTDELDPRAFRWVEAGVSGLARSRDWDAVALVELRSLEDDPLEEIRFGRFADGTILVEGDDPGGEVVDSLAARLEGVVRPPYEALASRRTRREWSLGVRELRVEELELRGVDAAEILVALGPDGDPLLVVDGVEVESATGALAEADSVLNALGRSRHRTYAVRARRTVGSRWAVSVDPL